MSLSLKPQDFGSLDDYLYALSTQEAVKAPDFGSTQASPIDTSDLKQRLKLLTIDQLSHGDSSELTKISGKINAL